MDRLPDESAERFALRALLEAMETPRTQKASAAWDAAHKVLEATRLEAAGYRIKDCRRFGGALPWEARRRGTGGGWIITYHRTREAALEACERDYRADLRR